MIDKYYSKLEGISAIKKERKKVEQIKEDWHFNRWVLSCCLNRLVRVSLNY